MTKEKIFLWIFFIFTLSTWTLGWSKAKTFGEVEEKLKEAHQSYSEKNYSRSKEILSQLAESFPDDPRFSYFELMIAKCEYHLKNYQSAHDGFEDFIKTFPQSRFIPACYFMLGNINYLWGKGFESAQNFVWAYQKAKDDEMKKLAAKSIEPLLQKKLSENELEQLAQKNKDKRLAPKIFFWLGKRRFDSQDYQKAKESLSYYQDSFPNGPQIKEVSILLEKLSSPTSKILKVGVLAPLTGEYSSYGESMLEGINLALQYSFMQSRVELVVKDTKGDSIRATSLSKEMIEDEGVIFIIGPLKGRFPLGAGIKTDGAKISLFSPTASEKEIGGLSEFVLQLSPSNQTKGKSLAEFVIQDQKLLDFVMLVSDDPSAFEFARGFEEEVKETKAKVMALEYFSEKTVDFITVLKKIKRMLLEIPVSAYVSEEEESFIDEIPIRVGGFFIAAGKDQMLKILPEIYYLEIHTTVIGAEDCTSSEVLNLASDLNQKLVFTSDTYHLKDEQAWTSFLTLYRNRYKEEPDRAAVLGFDAMNLLISIFEKGITSPEEIKESLLGIKNLEGASGAIQFDRFGENKNIPIYKCQGGKVEKLR
jgi:branched-chain amino acid transport system substrate-binding protein